MLPINVFPPIWIIILRNVLSMVPFQNVAPLSVVFPKEQHKGLYCFCYIYIYIYINDLPNKYCLFHFKQRIYIDDTHLTYSIGNIHSIQSSLNEDLLNINHWLTLFFFIRIYFIFYKNRIL